MFFSFVTLSPDRGPNMNCAAWPYHPVYVVHTFMQHLPVVSSCSVTNWLSVSFGATCICTLKLCLRPPSKDSMPDVFVLFLILLYLYELMCQLPQQTVLLVFVHLLYVSRSSQYFQTCARLGILLWCELDRDFILLYGRELATCVISDVGAHWTQTWSAVCRCIGQTIMSHNSYKHNAAAADQQMSNLAQTNNLFWTCITNKKKVR